MRRPGRAIALLLAAASVLVSGPSALAAVPAAAASGKTIVDQDGNSVRLSARTTVLDQATVAAVKSVTKDTIAFAHSTPQTAALSAGDIIVNQAVASTPVLITSVARAGGQTTLAVRETTTAAAYAQVKLHKRVHASRLASVSGTALTATGEEVPATTKVEVTPSLTGVKWKATIASDKFTKRPIGSKVTGVIETNGELSYQPDLDIHLDLAKRQFSVISTVKPTIKFDVTSNVEFEVTKDWAKPFRLGKLSFEPVVFTVGPIPFTVRPELEVGFGLSGKASAGLGIKFDCSTPAELTAGFRIGSTNEGLFSYNGCTNNSVAPAFNAMGTVEAKIPLTLFVKIDEIAGPFVRVTGSAYATADATKKPWFDWGLKVTGEFGGRIEAGPWQKDLPVTLAATLWQWPKKPTTTTAFKGVSSVTTTYNHAATTGAAKTFNYPGELLTLKANVSGGATAKKAVWSRTSQSKYDLWFVNPACTKLTAKPQTSGVCARRTSWTGATVKAYTYRDTALSTATPITSQKGIFTQGQFAYSVTTTDTGVSAPHTGSLSVLRTAPVKPTAATKLTGTPLEAGARLTWAAPADDGGTPVTRYRVYATTTADVAASRKTVEQLVYGTTVDLNRLAERVPYTITVTPLNRIGYGPAISTTVTPLAPIRASNLIKVAPASYTNGLDTTDAPLRSNRSFSSDGRHLYAYSLTYMPQLYSFAYALYRVDLTTGARNVVPQANWPRNKHPLTVSDDGSRVFNGHFVYDFSTGQAITLVPESVDVTSSTMSGNGQIAFWATEDDPQHVKKVRLANPSETSTLAVAVASYGQLVEDDYVSDDMLSVSGDGTQLLVRNTRTATDQCMPKQAGVVIETGSGIRQVVTPVARDCPAAQKALGVNVQNLGLSDNGRFVTFEISNWPDRFQQYIVDLQQTSPRLAHSLSAPSDMVDAVAPHQSGAVVSNDGRIAAWTAVNNRASGVTSLAAGCDRLTGSCAIATASGRADGQGEWEQAYFVNDCHTALWVAADGTVYRRDLTW